MDVMTSPQISSRAQVSDRRTSRLAAILALLTERGTVSVTDLAAELGVSQASLRRDLAVLEGQDLLKRVHGGATCRVLAGELPVRYRDGQRRDAKARIAAACVEAIPRRAMAVAISGGTTTTEVARRLHDRSELTVVTNAVNIATELATSPRLRVIIAGGTMRSESYEAVGAWTERFLEGLNFGVTVMGVDGISVAGGLTTHDAVEARTDQKMAERSQRLFVVADASKIGKVVLSPIVPASRVSMLFTEVGAPADEVARLRAAGVEVHLV